MSDLVDRLRQKYPETPHHRDSLHSEAADRIEHLERVLADARMVFASVNEYTPSDIAVIFPEQIAALDEALNTTDDRPLVRSI